MRRRPSHNERPGALSSSGSKGEGGVQGYEEASKRCVSVEAMRPRLSHCACEADGGYALSQWPCGPQKLHRALDDILGRVSVPCG